LSEKTQRFLTRFADRASTVFITGGGWLMIASLVLIFFLIASEAIPLFGTPSIRLVSGESALEPPAVPDPPPAEAATLAALAGETATASSLHDKGAFLCVGTASGRILVFSMDDPAAPVLRENVVVHPEAPAPVTVLGSVTGGQTLVTGDALGRVDGLLAIRERPDEETRRFVVAKTFEAQGAAVRAFAASPRGKTFLTGDDRGGILARFGTNGRTLARTHVEGAVVSLEMGPKGTTFTARTAGSRSGFALDAPHPEISWRSLFGKQLYEGYDRPEYVWQSSGSNDEFESKMSLVPLIFGTLKGTLYALLFAVPIALSAALYTSLFAPRNVKAFVKPIVEVMAALPSVVIGFLAGLWLAPVIQNATFTTLLLFPVVPLVVLAGVFLREGLPFEMRQRISGFREGVAILLLAAAGVALCAVLGPVLEKILFGGDFKGWLFSALHLRYDARNSLVIAFAMGFAVIPIIFTISEDALSSVPQHLKAASLALGASPWQTAVRVILPTASAGIFSALMVGFGRAVGETMIVLMAAGNTPIMEWSLFNGMRTLSANIAVEISEAPQGGTLFRVLFLSALLLFILTFLVNTLAEVLRQRLRRKYTVV
jgi:phosphate transport system permease protein